MITGNQAAALLTAVSNRLKALDTDADARSDQLRAMVGDDVLKASKVTELPSIRSLLATAGDRDTLKSGYAMALLKAMIRPADTHQ